MDKCTCREPEMKYKKSQWNSPSIGFRMYTAYKGICIICDLFWHWINSHSHKLISMGEDQ